MKAFERPSALMERRMMHSFSSTSSSCCASHFCARGFLSRQKVAAISALSAPGLTMEASARSPRHRPSASIAIDLPAPVSPVTAIRPWLKSTSRDLTTAK